MSAPDTSSTHPAVLIGAFVLGMGGVLWWRLGAPVPVAEEAVSATETVQGGAPDGPVRCDLPGTAAGAGRLTGRFGGRQLISADVALTDGVLDIDTRGIKSAGPERRWTDTQADTVLRLAGFTAGHAWLEVGEHEVLALWIDPDGGCRLAGRAEVQPPQRTVRCRLLGDGPLPLVAMVVTRPQPVGEGVWTLAPVELRLDRAERVVEAAGPATFTGTGWFSWDPAEGPDAPVGLPLAWSEQGCAPVLLP